LIHGVYRLRIYLPLAASGEGLTPSSASPPGPFIRRNLNLDRQVSASIHPCSHSILRVAVYSFREPSSRPARALSFPPTWRQGSFRQDELRPWRVLCLVALFAGCCRGSGGAYDGPRTTARWPMVHCRSRWEARAHSDRAHAVFQVPP
jgi:hypothetical protein